MFARALIAIVLALAVAVLPASLAAEPPPLKIAFLGDSLTVGLHASSPERMYQTLLVRRILGGGRDGVVIRAYQDPFGMTDDALARVGGVVEAQPDLIILEIGNHEAFAGGHEVALFEARYEELLDKLQGTGATVIAGTLAWLNYSTESREYANALRLNAIIRRLCGRRGIAVADLWTATVFRPDFISRPGDRSWVEPFDGDDLHPNDAGHRALADAFWEAYQRDRARRALGDLHTRTGGRTDPR